MADEQAPWYEIGNAGGIDTPALVIYPDRVRENIRTAIRMVHDVSLLRPHVKTHKSAQAAALCIEEGITKFKCATIAEAEMLALAGAPDVLLAYQPVGPKIGRLLRLVQTYPRTAFSCIVDDFFAARSIAEVFAAALVSLPVYIDVNVGMNRTGIEPGDEAVALYHACGTLEGIRPAGLHAYDGHIHESDAALRILQCRMSIEPVRALRQRLQDEGFDKPAIIAGGSPTFPIHSQKADVECSPGTFIYWDKSYELLLPEQPFLPAALVITRVVSQPSRTTLCLDAGHKSVASEKDLDHRLIFLNAPDARCISHSEEHLIIEVGEGHSFAIGDLFYGLPYHICPTCALFEEAVIVHDHTADGRWTMTARNRTLTI